jgi:hypothetical protein
VFVKKPGTTGTFERRRIFVDKENNDQVIVAEASPDHAALLPGEEIATTGSLILEQMYEDHVMVEGALLSDYTGAPMPGDSLSGRHVTVR